MHKITSNVSSKSPVHNTLDCLEKPNRELRVEMAVQIDCVPGS